MYSCTCTVRTHANARAVLTRAPRGIHARAYVCAYICTCLLKRIVTNCQLFNVYMCRL